MKTKNAKELASIITLLLSPDIESVKLGISLFSSHYLITNYPKYKKFKVSLKYKGYKCPSNYCSSYSSFDAEFNRDQFLRMLASKSIDINKKTCAIINFIYDNVNPRYIQRHNHKIKNPNYNDSLSHNMWGSSLDKFSVNDIKSRIWCMGKRTITPMSKKKERIITLDNPRSYFNKTIYLNVSEDLRNDCVDLNIDDRLCGLNDTPYSVIKEYKQYLTNRFINKGKHLVKSLPELEQLISDKLPNLTKYYINPALFK